MSAYLYEGAWERSTQSFVHIASSNSSKQTLGWNGWSEKVA